METVHSGWLIWAAAFLAAAGAPAPEPLVKCGRDCVVVAARSLGVDVDVSKVNALLSDKDEHSFEELREALQKLQIPARAVWCEPAELANLSAVLSPSKTIPKTVVLTRTISPETHRSHFVILLQVSSDGIELLDPSRGKLMHAAATALGAGSIPLLIVTRESVDLRAKRFGSSTDRASQFLQSWLASGTLTLLLALVCAWFVPWRSAVASSKRFFVSIRPRLRSWKVAAMVGGCSALLAIWPAIAAWSGTRPNRVLVFENERVDLGAVPVAARKTARFVLHNRGAVPISIAAYRASCTCVKVDGGSATLQPGEQRPINVDIVVELAGKHEYTLAVIPESQRIEPVSATVALSGYESTRLTPAAPNLGCLVVDDDRWHDLSLNIEDFHGSAARLSSVTPSSQLRYVDFALEPNARLKPDGRVIARYRPLPGVTAGQFWERFTLSTDEENPRTFAIALVGTFVPRYECSPPMLIVRPDAAGVPTGRVEIMSRGAPFRISKAAVQADNRNVSIDFSRSLDTRQTITLRQPPGAVGRDSMSLTIDVDPPSKSPLTVPVRFVQ